MTEQQTTWTFLTNHSHVLFAISKTSDIRVREIAVLVGITERAVLRIVQELSDAGFVVINKFGRENRYSVTSDVPLRHPLEQHRKVSELLEMLAGDNNGKS
ncbi:winged helix-turn-helix transcriptional regulator [Dehalococcoides mccartyi]|nr:winged helix-turn-helix transcriptional regulator [Dehalococcoides mccartyi]